MTKCTPNYLRDFRCLQWKNQQRRLILLFPNYIMVALAYLPMFLCQRIHIKTFLIFKKKCKQGNMMQPC